MSEIERPVPAYQQVYEDLRTAIVQGRYKEGDQLPSIRFTATRLGLAPATVSRAYQQLRAEGLTETTAGASGTTVAFGIQRISGDEYTSGKVTGKIYGGTRRAEIVAAEVVPATEEVARMMGLTEGDPVVRRERVTYTLRDDPMSTSVSYHDAALLDVAPKLVELARVPEGTPNYIQERTGYVGTQVVDMVSARGATSEEAYWLKVAPGSPVQVTRNTLSSDDGYVIEYGVSVTPPNTERVFRYAI
jgi:GntR family transcriptional regulator